LICGILGTILKKQEHAETLANHYPKHANSFSGLELPLPGWNHGETLARLTAFSKVDDAASVRASSEAEPA